MATNSIEFEINGDDNLQQFVKTRYGDKASWIKLDWITCGEDKCDIKQK